jgi:methionyl-tRNA formyltransferase
MISVSSNATRLRIAFAGTPEFARTALQALHEAGHDIVAVLTQPDRPSGRGMKLQASPVKAWAVGAGLPVFQPEGLKLDGRFSRDAIQAQAQLQAAQPDVMVVAAYGLILPAWVLALPKFGCLNIHASLLPRWRGAAPIHRAIEAGDAQTGITIMQMDEGLDTGDLLLERSMPIEPDDTTATLHDRLAALGAEMVVQALADLASGSLSPRPQPSEGVTYAHKIAKDEALIDWSLPAQVIERRIRAFDPFPGALWGHGDEMVKIWRAELAPAAVEFACSPSPAPGTILSARGHELIVACGQGRLRLLTLQRPGGRRISATEYLRAR